MATYYCDTNAVLKYYGRHYELDEHGILTLRRLISGGGHVVFVSGFTYVEFIGVLMKSVREGNLRWKQADTVVNRFRSDTNTFPDKTTRPFTAIHVPDELFRHAGRLLLDYGHYRVSTVDMMHIAIADKLRVNYPDVIFITSDNGIQRVCREIKLPVYDPEIDV